MTQTNRPLAAAGVIFASMALISLVDTFFVRIAEVAGLWQFHLLRALMALPLMVAFSRVSGVAIIPVKTWAVLFRGFCLSGSMIFYFGSLAFLTVPQAAAGLFTSPLWVLLLTTVVLRQRIGPRRLAAVAAGFVGAFLVLNPGASGFTFAYLMPVVGGFMYGLSAIATRTWCAGETALSLLAAFFFCMIFWGLGGIAVLTFFDMVAPHGVDGLLLRSWGPLSGEVWFWIAAQTFTALFGLYGLTRGYQLAEASYAAIFEYSFLVFASLWALVLFFNVPTGGEMIGILAILGSGLLIAASPAARRATGTK